MTAACRASPNRVIIDGQSLNLLADTGALWPTRAFQGHGVPFNNVSRGSTAWTHLINSAFGRVYPLFRYAQRVVFVMGIGGQSDLIDESQTGQSIYNELVFYAEQLNAAATAAGCSLRMVGVTVPPSTGIVGTKETQRAWLNVYTTNDDSNIFDAVVDTTTVVTDAGDPAQLYDGTHMASASHIGVAALMGPAVRSLYL